MKLNKKQKKLAKNNIGVMFAAVALTIGSNIIKEVLSGFNILADLQWNDLIEHRYEILDQLIAEKYFNERGVIL